MHRICLVLSLLLLVCCSALQAAEAELLRGSGDYAVVVSRNTHNDSCWQRVVGALRRKHDASVVVYSGDLDEALPALASVFPRYVCFVARPEDAGRMFVVAAHRLMRRLDDDPYTDAIWGILTGYEAKDALWIAEARKPLTVRRGLGGTSLNLNVFEEGVWYSEGSKTRMVQKTKGGKPEGKKSPEDTTRCFVEDLNKNEPDLFMTSGHATERDWQIGYSYKDGQLRCKGGQLVGVDTKGKVYPVNSPNPKVFLPVGNCLIGHVKDRESMALALMRTGGVHQMFGYTVVTWYGYGGWGVRDLFIGQPGRFTLAEAFYINQQALLHQIETRFPTSAKINFKKFGHRDIGAEAARNGLLKKNGKGLRSKDEVGLLWDRDTVAFYGDPAWEARMVKLEKLAWKQELTKTDGAWAFRVTPRRDGKWPKRPIAQLLPYRLGSVTITKGADLKPVITDNFILLPLKGSFSKDDKIEITFRAKKVAGSPDESR